MKKQSFKLNSALEKNKGACYLILMKFIKTIQWFYICSFFIHFCVISAIFIFHFESEEVKTNSKFIKIDVFNVVSLNSDIFDKKENNKLKLKKPILVSKQSDKKKKNKIEKLNIKIKIKKDKNILKNNIKKESKTDIKIKDKLKKTRNKKENKQDVVKKEKIKNKWFQSVDARSDYLEYSNKLYFKIYDNWIIPVGTGAGTTCDIIITQNKYGVVKSIKKTECYAKGLDMINSIKRAVMSSSPLPLPKDNRLFDKNIYFSFSV